jgi:hypothetical protein
MSIMATDSHVCVDWDRESSHVGCCDVGQFIRVQHDIRKVAAEALLVGGALGAQEVITPRW